MTVYVTPRAILSGPAAEDALTRGWAWPMPGGNAFLAALVSRRTGTGFIHTQITHASRGADAEADAAIAAIGASRPDFVATAPAVMGILNVTPDSFSDGGRFSDPEAAIARGIAMAEAGAAIIDVGGESTRPGAAPVGESEEIARIRPVIAALANRGLKVSIDSRHTGVISAGLEAGAAIINDIAALTAAGAVALAAKSKAHVILMHMQGEPGTMQDNPIYGWAAADVFDFLRARIEACIAGGIAPDRIAIDPGLGFGKTAAHNTDILNHLAMYHSLGCALAVGASRKSFIGKLSRAEGTESRLGGSISCALAAAAAAAQIIRVHDVLETRQALALQTAIGQAAL